MWVPTPKSCDLGFQLELNSFDLFKIDLLENFLLTNLKERMDDFVMEEFQQELV